MLKVVVVGNPKSNWIRKNCYWLLSNEFDIHIVDFKNSVKKYEIEKNDFYTTHTKGKSTILSSIYSRFYNKIRNKKRKLNNWDLIEDILTLKKRNKYIHSLKPDILIGHKFDENGLLFSLVNIRRKYVICWGGDIINAPSISPLHYFLTKYITKKVFILLGSSYEAYRLSKKFNSKKIIDINWAHDDLSNCAIPTQIEKIQLKEKYRIRKDSKVVLNARRFKKEFGAYEVTDSCIMHAKNNIECIYIFLEGVNNSLDFEYLKRSLSLEKSHLSKRFILLEGEIKLSVFIDFLKISDIFISFRGKGDMRALTVIQGMACGSTPLVNAGNKEWKDLNKKGAHLILVEAINKVLLAKSMESSLNISNEKANSIRDKNKNYLSKYYDSNVNRKKFIDFIKNPSSK